jgi:hypothetical protein
MKKKMATATLAVVCLALGAGASFAHKKEKKTSEEGPVKERFAATLSPPPMSMNASVTIVVKDYTTDAEMKDYSTVYLRGGDGALQRALDKAIGYFTIGGSTGFSFVLVRSISNGSSRTEFMIGIGNPNLLTPSADLRHSHFINQEYPYSLISLQLDANGNGSGVLYQYAKLQFDARGAPHVIPMEQSPLKLVDVHPMKH